MSRHRPKLIVVVKGQPLFDAETHHFEQARCRLCGAIITADGTGAVTRGLGSSYITYDWSACAMLLVMHYFAGLPFKRLESLQAGWGIPLSDANQWTLTDASADLLFPLYKALERHGVQGALALRIDDTGSMIVAVGDRHMSLIATANANGIEPVAYLTECLDNHEDLAQRPEHYLPWVYRARLEAHEEPKQTRPPSPVANRSATRQVVEHPLRPGTHRSLFKDATGPPPTTAALS